MRLNILNGLPVITLLLASLMLSCSPRRNSDTLESQLREYVEDKDAVIGIAVITHTSDTVAMNGDMRMPMMSVYKFPIALAVAERCRQEGTGFDDPVTITSADMHRDTYSPMRAKYGDIDSARITLRELLVYSLQQSDNNASDILLRHIGGAKVADSLVRSMGIDGISILWSEDDMHRDTTLCRENSATPIAMASLMARFDREYDDTLSRQLKLIMETCETGADRLPAPLTASGAVIGHKTGTGDLTPAGRISALNDAGYVHLPDGTRYSIAVFVADAAYGMAETEEIIAGISEIVFRHSSH